MEVFVGQLVAHSSLHQGLDSTLAAEIVWGSTSPEIYNLFTVDRGWPKEKYVDWLGDALVQLLLME